jgi:hypothetical protein
MKNSKTTMAGVAAILTAIAGAMNSYPAVDWASVIAAVIAGLGLIFASDAKGGNA